MDGSSPAPRKRRTTEAVLRQVITVVAQLAPVVSALLMRWHCGCS